MNAAARKIWDSCSTSGAPPGRHRHRHEDRTAPMTKEERAAWEELRAHKEKCTEFIVEIEETLRDNPNHEDADFMRDEIQRQRKLLAKIETVIKD